LGIPQVEENHVLGESNIAQTQILLSTVASTSHLDSQR